MLGQKLWKNFRWFVGKLNTPQFLSEIFWPLKYYSVNVAGSIHLVEVMEEFKVKKIVFSSSATVFGEPEYLPIDEIHPTGKCINPYGRTKYFFEEFLKDLNNSNKPGDDLVSKIVLSKKSTTVVTLKFINSEKTTKLEEISLLVLTLLKVA